MSKAIVTSRFNGSRKSGHSAWFQRQVQIGLDSANAGNLIPSSEVEAKFAARRAATRGRLKL